MLPLNYLIRRKSRRSFSIHPPHVIQCRSGVYHASNPDCRDEEIESVKPSLKQRLLSTFVLSHFLPLLHFHLNGAGSDLCAASMVHYFPFSIPFLIILNVAFASLIATELMLSGTRSLQDTFPWRLLKLIWSHDWAGTSASLCVHRHNAYCDAPWDAFAPSFNFAALTASTVCSHCLGP